MAFTYGDSPSTVQRDEVRLLCGDTASFGDMSLTDAEIAYCITEKTTSLLAAIFACELLSSKCAKYVDTSNIGLSVSASQRSRRFAERAAELKASATRDARLGATMFVGGLSKAGVDAHEADTDAVQPFFARGGDDFQHWSADDDD